MSKICPKRLPKSMKNYFQIYLRYKFYTEVFLIGAQKLFTYLKVQSNKTRVLNEI